MRTAFQLALAACLLPVAALANPGHGHGEGHGHGHGESHSHEAFSAGEPGNPKRPARVVNVTAREADGKMLFSPDRVEARKGEQVRFVVRNSGALKHEFTLASIADNDKHAATMQANPDMHHDDPNAKSIEAGKSAEIVWRFSKAGTFEFACLIPGHREAGMRGSVTVK